MDILQNTQTILVTPIVEDVFEQIGIRPLRYRLKEVATFKVYSLVHATTFEKIGTAFDHAW